MKTIYIIQCYHTHNNRHILTCDDAYTVRTKAEGDMDRRNTKDNADGIYYKIDTIFIDAGN